MRPEPDESFASFMDRLASRNLVPLLAMLAHLGLVERAHFLTLPSGYGMALPDLLVARIACAIDRNPEEIARTLVARYDGAAIDFADVDPAQPGSIRRACAREWVYGAGSHFCPACLAEKPVWNVAWKLPWSFACSRHRALLAALCPACGARAGAGRRDGRTVPALPTVEPIPGHCHAPLPPGEAVPGRKVVCGFPLELAETDDLSEFAGTLSAQMTIDRLLRRAPGIETLGAFRRLRSICALVLAVCSLEDLGTVSYTSEQAWVAYEEHRDQTMRERRRLVAEGISGRNGPRVRYWQRVPESAGLMAAIVPRALRVAGLADISCDLNDELRPLLARARARQPTTVAALPRWFSFPPDLARAWADLIKETSPRFFSALPRPQAGAHPRLEPRHVPRLISEDHYQSHLSELCPGLRADTLRAFASMAILRVLGVPTWDECGGFLGLERDYARRHANNAVVKLNQAGAREAFWRAIAAIHSELDQGELVDYREREVILKNWTVIPIEDWTSIRREASIADDRRGARRRNASAWLWADLTGRHWSEAPAFGGCASESAREVFRRFEKDILPVLRASLTKAEPGLLRSMTVGRLSRQA